MKFPLLTIVVVLLPCGEVSAQNSPIEHWSFAAERVDEPWATRMESRILAHLELSEFTGTRVTYECRSTACLIELTSATATTSAERGRYITKLNEMINQLVELSDDDIIGVVGASKPNSEQSCRTTSRFVLYRDATSVPSVSLQSVSAADLACIQ